MSTSHIHLPPLVDKQRIEQTLINDYIIPYIYTEDAYGRYVYVDMKERQERERER